MKAIKKSTNNLKSEIIETLIVMSEVDLVGVDKKEHIEQMKQLQKLLKSLLDFQLKAIQKGW